jgi:hypothetical protein
MSSKDDPHPPRAPSPVAAEGAPPRFEIVPLRGRVDGWTPDRQIAYVAALARWGSGRLAAACVGVTAQSAARLRRRPEAASFARACEAACTAGKIRRISERTGAATFSPQGPGLSEKYEPSSSLSAPRPAPRTVGQGAKKPVGGGI